MSFNLVDLIKEQVSGQVLGQISNAVGESSDKTKSVVEGAIPALLGGFMDKASSSEGAGALFDAVNNQDDSLLDNLSGMISSDNKSSLIESGGNALGSLFGDSGASGLVSAISGSSGVSSGGTNAILGMVAPMVMSTLKRFMSGGDSNDASGLASMLASQKDNIAGAMPSGLADQLGSSGFMSNVSNLFESGTDAAAKGVDGLADAVSGAASNVSNIANGAANSVTDAVSGAANTVGDAAGNVAEGAANLADSAADTVSGAANSIGNAAGDAASTGSSWIKKLIIPLVLAVLAFFGWKQFGGSAPDVSGAATSTSESASNAVSGAAQSAVAAVSNMAGSEMSEKITSMFGSATESLSSITDVESAKAAIPSLTDFSGKLDGITAMADKLPDAAKPILAGALKKAMPMLDSVMEIPGVGAVLGGVIEPLKEKLSGLAG